MGDISWARRAVLVLIVFGLFSCESGETQVQRVLVASPSGDVRMTVSTDAEGRMTYSVTRNGQLEIESSPLGLLSTTHDLTAGVTMASSSGRAVDESYTMLVGKQRDRQITGSEITVPLRDANGARAELIMRAHEDGVAFRYHLLGEGMSQVTSESTGFTIPPAARVLTRPYDSADATFPTNVGAYERAPEILPLGEATEATGFAFPALFELEASNRYVMISEADLDRNYCGTRLDEMPEGGLYRVRFPDEREGRGIGEVLPNSPLPFMTPWRAAWSWFTQETGTPELQSEYVDFAGEYGWDYVLIDAKWDHGTTQSKRCKIWSPKARRSA